MELWLTIETAVQAFTSFLFIKGNVRIQKENRSDPNSYCVNAYDCGIKGYEAVRIVTRIVNHKRTKVQEVKEYKSKPTRVLKGATLREVHTFIVDYDYRDYDPLEHGGFCI